MTKTRHNTHFLQDMITTCHNVILFAWLYSDNLPCKFPQIFVIVVYIHPKAKEELSKLSKPGEMGRVLQLPFSRRHLSSVMISDTKALESRDWNVFNNSSAVLDERPVVISSYILYLKDSVVPTKHVKVFSNNKPG